MERRRVSTGTVYFAQSGLRPDCDEVLEAVIAECRLFGLNAVWSVRRADENVLGPEHPAALLSAECWIFDLSGLPERVYAELAVADQHAEDPRRILVVAAQDELLRMRVPDARVRWYGSLDELRRIVHYWLLRFTPATGGDADGAPDG